MIYYVIISYILMIIICVTAKNEGQNDGVYDAKDALIVLAAPITLILGILLYYLVLKEDE